MATSILEQYKIADFLEWMKQKKIVLNPSFQRRAVWSSTAKTFLIDTMLRRMPIPKIYLRTIIDLKTRTSLREVVDGQQRLRAIFEFASDQLVLGKAAKEFQGKNYSSLQPEHQEIFLSYAIGTEQLVNANDNEVLEVFARLNSYTVPLNSAELRHAKYQGDFKWVVHESGKKWSILWERFGVVTVRQRVRMLDDALMAAMCGIVLEGVRDGGERNINRLYEKYDKDFPEQDAARGKVDENLRFITTELEEALIEPIVRAPHFLMLFAAIAHALHGIPEGDMGKAMPALRKRSEINLNLAKENISKLSAVIEGEEPEKPYKQFWLASKGTTHRIASRKERFPMIYKALYEPL